MFIMKIKKILTVFIAMFILTSMGSCKKDNWAVKIDDDVITIDEFNNYYYTQNKIILNKSKKEIDELAKDPAYKEHPTLNKNNFMDFLISRKLLYKKALSDDSLSKDVIETVTDLFTLQGVSTYYLTEKLKDEVSVTDNEIDDFYKKNRSLFKGVPINNDIAERIKQQIFLQKFEQKSSEFVMELIAESKVVKDGFQKYMTELTKKGEKKDAKDKKKIDLDETAVIIDKEKISLKKFLDYYYTQNKILLNMSNEEIDKIAAEPYAENHPTLNKQKFMDFLISRKLLYKKTMEDKTLNKDDIETIIDLFKLQGVATYYLTEKLKDQVEITDEEIEKFYVNNKKLFKGVPINEEVANRIKQQLFLQKFEQKSSEFVMNLIAEAMVNREGFRKYLQKEQEEQNKPEGENNKQTE